MGDERSPGKPTTRRYTPDEKARAVRLVRQLRKELGATHGTIQRVAGQIGCGVESLQTWARQADIDDGVGEERGNCRAPRPSCPPPLPIEEGPFSRSDCRRRNCLRPREPVDSQSFMANCSTQARYDGGSSSSGTNSKSKGSGGPPYESSPAMRPASSKGIVPQRRRRTA